MARFVHHPDGYFILDGLQVSAALFQRFAPDYRLPQGAIGRIYDPGIKHSLITSSGETPLALAWAPGDRYLQQQPTLARFMAQRENGIGRDGGLAEASLLKRSVESPFGKVKPLWQ